MRRGAAFLAWVSLGLCSASVGSTACFGGVCTLIGCSDSEELDVSTDIATVSDTDISVCRNQRCWHGHVATSDLAPSAVSSGAQLQADDGQFDAVYFTIDSHTGPSVTLRFSWSLSNTDVAASGDTLTATFSDSTGNPVLSQSATIGTFSDYYPNGKDCDKVGCKVANVKGTAAP